jgi:hypothetical protein
MKKFYNLSRVFAERIGTRCWSRSLRKKISGRFDTDNVSREAWRSLAEEPRGRAIERYFKRLVYQFDRRRS